MRFRFLILLLVLMASPSLSCSHDHDSPCECIDDLDCSVGHLCDEEKCICYPDYDCTRDDQCTYLGPCMECRDLRCTSFACEVDAECPDQLEGQMYCGDFDDMVGCRRCEYDGCRTDEICKDPDYPLYVECQNDERPKCFTGVCQCRPPCGGSCPDGQYCCRQSQTCDPIPTPCWGVECPPGEQVNPDPGGTLNEETCEVEGADCSCVPNP